MGYVILATNLVLVFLATVRLVRLIISDDLGLMLIQEPLHRFRDKQIHKGNHTLSRYLEGLSCPFCIGYWVGLLVLLSFVVSNHYGGYVLLIWQLFAGSLSLNWVAAHFGIYFGDFDNAEDV